MRSPPASTSRLLRVVAGFQVSITGRLWVSTEAKSNTGSRIASLLSGGGKFEVRVGAKGQPSRSALKSIQKHERPVATCGYAECESRDGWVKDLDATGRWKREFRDVLGGEKNTRHGSSCSPPSATAAQASPASG